MTSGHATARAASHQTLLLRPEEVAAELRIARRRIFEMIREGTLPSVKIGKSRRISRQAVEAYIAGLESAQGGGDAPAA
jgi:excisionase family DNA binding protein